MKPFSTGLDTDLNEESISGSEVACLCSKPSGHGISAALLMATVRAALRQRVSRKGSLKDIISDVNRQLVSDVEESGLFISLFYLVVDQPKRTIKWRINFI